MVHKKGTKLEPPLKLDMSFGEAMDQLARVKPEEVEASIQAL